MALDVAAATTALVNAAQTPAGQAAITAATGGSVNPATIAVAAEIGKQTGVLPQSATSSNTSGTDRYKAYMANASAAVSPTPNAAAGSSSNDGIDGEVGNRGIMDDTPLNQISGDSWTKTAPRETHAIAEKPFSLATLADKLNNLTIRNNEAGMIFKAIQPNGVGDALDQVADMAWQSSGMGGQLTQMAQIFGTMDRYEHSAAPRNTEFSGYTFITRPRLNLSDANLAGDRKFMSMRTGTYKDVAFAIRCMLDTRFCMHHYAEASASAINLKNPFCALLFNAITGISGFNDPILTTETTEGGYFQEDQTYAIGGDRMAHTYDITCTFRDYAGGPVAATFDYWYQYMSDIQDGTMIQYSNAIDANRMDYTVSIYRFIFDRVHRTITRWAKCTGCFPVNSPQGVPFNKGQGETMVSSNDNFSIVFKANRIEYNDPIILHEFNMLVRRYAGFSKGSEPTYAYAYEPQNNFVGIPYIRVGNFGYELVWLRDSTDGSYGVSGSGSLAGLGKI